MTYAYDNYVQLPVVDLYDTNIMKMAIEAAKDMYDKGQDLIKDFYKTYGDFMSPFAKDMEAYGQMMGGVRDLINNAYANGIDLLKSPEGRMLISKAVNSVDPGLFNLMRTNAKLGFEYLKNIEEAKAKNEFSLEFEDYLLDKRRGGPGRLDEFSSANGAMWNRPGPGRYQTVDELIEPIVKNVDYTFDEAMTKAYNDGNNYYSVTRDRLAKAVDDNMSDILATQSGAFHYWKALLAAGGNEELAKLIFNTQIANRLSDHEKVKFEADPFKLEDRRSSNNIKEAWAKEAAQSYYSILPYADKNGDGVLLNSERADFAKLKNNGGDNNEENSGYSLAEDVYITSLKKGAGLEYVMNNEVTVNDLPDMLNLAVRNQNAAIKNEKSVFNATGMFISPQKIAGLILSNGKNGNGFFLNPGYFKNLHDLLDIRTSYKGWMRPGSTSEQSKEDREKYKQLSKDKLEAIKNTITDKKGEYKLKVVPTYDKNGNNVYSMVGDDNKWHTYALVRVYLSDGHKLTTNGGKERKYYTSTNELAGNDVDSKFTTNKYDIPDKGVDMCLEVGLHSNEGKASPDLSLSAREDLGTYAYEQTKKWIGNSGNKDWPWGGNSLSNKTTVSSSK